MDFAFALLEIVAEFVHAAEETDVFLDEDGFTVGIEFFEFFDDFVASFFISVLSVSMAFSPLCDLNAHTFPRYTLEVAWSV